MMDELMEVIETFLFLSCFETIYTLKDLCTRYNFRLNHLDEALEAAIENKVYLCTVLLEALEVASEENKVLVGAVTDKRVLTESLEALEDILENNGINRFA